MVLNKAAMFVLDGFESGDELQTWRALRLLYRVSPPTVKKVVKEDFDKINEQLAQADRRVRNSDPLVAHTNQTKEIERILRGQNELFFDKIAEKLHEEGYWEKKSRKIPTGMQKGLGDEDST